MDKRICPLEINEGGDRVMQNFEIDEKEAMEYWYDEVLCNLSEDDKAEVFDD